MIGFPGSMGRVPAGQLVIHRTRALQGTSAVTGVRLSADLDRLVRRLENQCRGIHGKYMAARGHVPAVCAYVETASKKHRRARRAA